MGFGQAVVLVDNTSGDPAIIMDGLVQTSLLNTKKITGITPLTETGDTAAIDVSGFGVYGYEVAVASIGEHAKLRLRGNISGDYSTLALEEVAGGDLLVSNNEVTITRNGSYILSSKASVVNVKLDFYEESGDTVVLSPNFFARRV